MRAKEGRGLPGELGFIQREGLQQGAAQQEGVPHAAVVDVVSVSFCLAIVAGMEIRGGLAAAEHGDLLGQVEIQRGGQVFAGNFRAAVEITDELPGVHTGVGARTARDAQGLARGTKDGVLKRGLHGGAVGLGLPAAEGGAVETEG